MKNVLLDKGIILPSGEISKDKVNLVTGAITQPFAEMVWVTTGGDMETVNRLTDVLVTMNTSADRGKLFGSVTGKDISALIKRDFGFDVDKRKIVTKSDIKSFGTFTAEARLFTGIVAQFSVKVEEE